MNTASQFNQKKEVLLDVIIDAFDAFIYVCSADYRIHFLNKHFIRRLGYDASGELCYRALFKRSSMCAWCDNVHVFHGETHCQEIQNPTDDRWYSLTSMPINPDQAKVYKLALMADIHDHKVALAQIKQHRDHLENEVKLRTSELQKINAKLRQEIEERKSVEKILRESETKYRELVQNTNSIILRFDTHGHVTFFNEFAQQFFGYKEEDIIGQHLVGTIIPEKASSGQNLRAMFQDFFQHPERYENNENENICRNGKKVWVAWTNKAIHDSFGKIREFLSVGIDITERKRAKERIHTLTQQLIKAQETERQRISRDLHDHLAQDLSSLKISSETLFDKQPAQAPEVERKVDEIAKKLQDCITTVRNMAYHLRPPGLDQMGLVRTVYQYCEDFAEKADIKIDFFSAGLDEIQLEFHIEINLYRLVQEALNNIMKHAEATTVKIRLVASFPKIILRIEDNGKGFDVEGSLHRASPEKRMGLISMEERVSLLNGSLKIQSRLMVGTKISIEIPIKSKKNGR